MYSLAYSLSTLSADEALILADHGEIAADDPPAEPEPFEPGADDREWAAETFGADDDDHGVDLTPIDITVMPPSARYTPETAEYPF